jgi:hypothetical protein
MYSKPSGGGRCFLPHFDMPYSCRAGEKCNNQLHEAVLLLMN